MGRQDDLTEVERGPWWTGRRVKAPSAEVAARMASRDPAAELAGNIARARLAVEEFAAVLEKIAPAISAAPASDAEAEFYRLTDELAVTFIRKLGLQNGERVGPYRVITSGGQCVLENRDAGLTEIGQHAQSSYRASIDQRRWFLRWLPDYLRELENHPRAVSRRVASAQADLDQARSVRSLLGE